MICKTCSEPFYPKNRQLVCQDCKINRIVDAKLKEIINSDLEWWHNNSRTPDAVDDEEATKGEIYEGGE
jgi:hypothetical protein